MCLNHSSTFGAPGGLRPPTVDVDRATRYIVVALIVVGLSMAALYVPPIYGMIAGIVVVLGLLGRVGRWLYRPKPIKTPLSDRSKPILQGASFGIGGRVLKKHGQQL